MGKLELGCFYLHQVRDEELFKTVQVLTSAGVLVSIVEWEHILVEVGAALLHFHRRSFAHLTALPVKSVDLDSWTDEQLQSMLKWGNSRANKSTSLPYIAIDRSCSHMR